MKISVIVPLYNKEKHITRTVESILHQTHSDFELIIIDDGSTDNGYSVAQNIIDNRIKLYKQENKGVSAARNKGVSLSKSDYITFLDADDTWTPDYLENIVMLINKYPQADYFATSYEYHYSKNEIVPTGKYYEKPENWDGIIDDYFEIAYDGPLLMTSCTTIKKSAFISVGMYREGIRFGEDIDLWTALGIHHTLAYKNKICSTYHYDAQNRSQHAPHLLEYDLASYVEEKYLQPEMFKDQSIYYKEYLIRVVLDKINYAIDSNRNKDARKLICKYRYSKLYRKQLIRAYIASFISYRRINKIMSILKKQ